MSICRTALWLMLFASLTSRLVTGQSQPFRPFQRLQLPTSGSRLTVSPGLTFPSLQLNTIESAFTMKMPIKVQFPTAAEMASTFILNVAGMPINYNTMRSASEITNSSKSRALHARINSRAKLYETIEKSHKTLGKSCLLRAICEVAEVPFVASSTGFLGEIFDMLLT